MRQLTLEIQEGTTNEESENNERRVHFYQSSLRQKGSNAPLLTIATRGSGMRMTPEQVVSLRDYLNDWLGVIHG